jgi:molybdopterin/thiamine biosynthesis adenylyltransferase
MKLNNIPLTEEEKKIKLERISFHKAIIRPVKVCSPVTVDKEENDLALVGFQSYYPLSFNITDYFQAGGSFENGHYPFFKDLGARIIGYFLGPSSVDKLRKQIGFTIADWLQSRPEEAINYLKNLSGMEDNFPGLPFITGFKENNETVFLYYAEGRFNICETESYSLSLDVFSRNTGILETGMMKSMTAVISGCGSVGSYVALELARSGIGRFLLIDSDVLGYSNVCRHQCGIADVGRFKTLAVADRIRLINPEAEIGVQNSLVENVPSQVFDRFCGPDSIIVGCADNRQGDLFTCKIASHYRMPMVSIGFWERAFAGEVFYWIPENADLACYQCFTKALGDISGRQSVNRRFYTTEVDLSKVNFMPGISADITFVTNIGAKIILDIFNRKNPKFVPRLLDSLTQFTLIANTEKKEIGGEQAAIFSYPLQVTTSIVVQKMTDCKICNKSSN